MDFLPKDPAILEIRKAERQDVPLLLEFIKGIARYAKLLQLLNIHRTFRIVS